MSPCRKKFPCPAMTRVWSAVLAASAAGSEPALGPKAAEKFGVEEGEGTGEVASGLASTRSPAAGADERAASGHRVPPGGCCQSAF